MTSIETTSVLCSCYGTPTKSLIQHVRTFSVSSKLLCADWNCSLLALQLVQVTIFIIQWTNFQIYSYIESQHNFFKNSVCVGQILGPHSAGPACTARLARPIVTPLLKVLLLASALFISIVIITIRCDSSYCEVCLTGVFCCTHYMQVTLTVALK